MNQNATGVNPLDEWHSVQGFALRNPGWKDASSVSSRSASLHRGARREVEIIFDLPLTSPRPLLN